MGTDTLNAAILVAIKHTAVPHIDQARIVEVFGSGQAEMLISQISALIRDAASTPVEWGDMTLQEGVNDIVQRFHQKHPQLSQEALHEIGRCVGWNLR